MLQRDQLREADFLTALILIGLGVAVVAGAFRMPMQGTYGGMPITWYTSPGFFPLLLGLLLVVCGGTVLIRCWRDGAHRRLPGRLRSIRAALPRSRVAGRILTIWVLLAGYALCLGRHPFAGLGLWFEPLGHSPLTRFLAQPEGANYVASSSIFLALFMIAFYRSGPGRSRWVTRSLLLPFSLLVAWSVAYLFTQHLYSPLPW